jgi:hypothetical protein
MIHHFVLPHRHKKKHRKAHLLSVNALTIYVIFFIFMQAGFGLLRQRTPGVLGTTSAITRQEIINQTNERRKKYGLGDLRENNILDKAAEDKAKNMFSENYWAHISPTGTTPWYWFQKEGYQYEYAGENLARGFSDSGSVMDAWMASTMGHKENVLGKDYQEIGIAVEDGILNGEKTTLVVQLFGSPAGAIAKVPEIETPDVTNKDNKIATSVPSSQAPQVLQKVNSANTKIQTKPSMLGKYITIDPYVTTKTTAMFLIGLLAILGIVDVLVLWRRKALAKVHIRHLPHVSVIAGLTIIVLILRVGAII